MRRNNNKQQQSSAIETKNFYDLLGEDEQHVSTNKSKGTNNNKHPNKSVSQKLEQTAPAAVVVDRDLNYYRQFSDKSWYDMIQ